MKFAAATVLAFAASAFAQTSRFLFVSVATTGLPVLEGTTEVEVNAGSSISWVWEAPGGANTDAKWANQEVTVGLIGGSANNAQSPIQTIGTVNTGAVNEPNAAARTFTWNIPAGFGGLKVYGLTFTLASDTSVFQYSPAFHIITGAATTSASVAPTGTKTISLSSHSAVYTVPAGGYTTVDVVETTTVPCANGTIPATSAVYVPPKATVPASVPVVSVPCNNATLSTSYVPPVYTAPSSPYSPSTTPVATPVTGAAARFAAPVAVVAGAVLAAFAL